MRSIPLWLSECLIEMRSGICGGEVDRWQLCQQTAVVLVRSVLVRAVGPMAELDMPTAQLCGRTLLLLLRRLEFLLLL